MNGPQCGVMKVLVDETLIILIFNLGLEFLGKLSGKHKRSSLAVFDF